MHTEDLLLHAAKYFYEGLGTHTQRRLSGQVQDPEDVVNGLTEVAAELRRVYLGRKLHALTGGVVQHGFLQGFNLGAHSTWCEQDVGTKLLGFYEQEVCELLQTLCRTRDTLIDLGGADGFYAVGAVATGHYQQTHCYEIQEASRANIVAIATAASVQDRVHVYGEATPDFARDLVAQGVEMSRAVVLVDIEGAEFEVLTDACLESLRDAHVIVELHDFMVPNGAQRRADLLQRAERFFELGLLQTGSRNTAGVPLLANWPDTDRWLLCSETRGTLMSWLHLSPKASF